MRHKFPLIMLTAFILVSVHLAQAQSIRAANFRFREDPK